MHFVNDLSIVNAVFICACFVSAPSPFKQEFADCSAARRFHFFSILGKSLEKFARIIISIAAVPFTVRKIAPSAR